MAVAVKNETDVSPPRLLRRMAAVSLAGTVYVLVCLGIIFYLIPSLWWSVLPRGSWAAATFLGLIMVAAVLALTFVGVRLLTPRAVPGVRAGIFAGLVGFLVVLLLTRWASMWVEYWVFSGLFGPSGPTVGPIVVGVICVVLLLVGIRLFFKPGFEKQLLRLEAQGWFSGQPYKRLQGLRVRRGTIFGILVLVGAGIYTMLTHGTLTRGPRDWQLIIPFTGKVTITTVGDVGPQLKERFPDSFLPGPGYKIKPDNPPVVDRYALKDINSQVDPAHYVKIYLQNDASKEFEVGKVVSREQLDAEVQRLKGEGLQLPVGRDPVPAGGDLHFATLTLLPGLPWTIPLLLLAVSLWLAWRVVNMPTFADFLIATEAELNKVSWVTQRRLVQDTIVVLVTVALLALFLFTTDQIWRVTLSWRPIGVLQIPEQEDKNTNVENQPW
jgi:preprotein translocase SecE subunit